MLEIDPISTSSNGTSSHLKEQGREWWCVYVITNKKIKLILKIELVNIAIGHQLVHIPEQANVVIRP